MKNGIFTFSAKMVATLILFASLQGCASFLEVGQNEDDPADFDRGYTATADDANANANCTDDDCHTAAARRAPASVDEDQPLSGPQKRVRDAIDTRDVVLGMTRSEVQESWGRPTQREVAGRGDTGHERWVYGSRYSLNGERTVIFENGKVAGWDH